MSDSVFDRLSEGLRNCTPALRSLLEDLAALTGEPVTGGLVASAQLCDDVTALARGVAVLQAELARRTHAATVSDVLPSSATTVLSVAGVPYGVALATRRAGRSPPAGLNWADWWPPEP